MKKSTTTVNGVNNAPNNEPTPNRKEGKTMTNTNTMAVLLKTYESATLNRTTDPTAYTHALQTLATAVAYSVLKKCINVGYSDTLVRLRRGLAHDLATLDKVAYTNQTAYSGTYNTDGNYTAEIADRSAADALTATAHDSLTDGIDLVHDAVVAILEETEKARDRNGGTLTGEYMKTPYTVRRLKKKVWIKKEDSANGWETVETVPIREVYKAVRRAIMNSRAVQAGGVYTYLNDIATDPETGIDETIYRRFGKYTDIGGTVRDYNGAETAYTVDKQTADDLEELIAQMNLTARQAKVLQLRLSGYGHKAISTYLGVSESTIKTILKRMQDKLDLDGAGVRVRR